MSGVVAGAAGDGAVLMSGFGFQVERFTPEAKALVERSPPALLKVYGEAAGAVDVISAWREKKPDGLLVVRLNRGDDTSLDTNAIFAAMAQAAPLKPYRPIVEVPVNEGHQTSRESLAALADYTVVAVDALCVAGYDVCIGNLGEGNPPNLGDWRWFLVALRHARSWWAKGRRVYLGLHEYWLPPQVPVNDGWHSARYVKLWGGEPAHAWSALPEDARIPILIGEAGIDGGIGGARRKGWRSYVGAAAYASDLRAYRDHLPPYVHGVAVFLAGAQTGYGWEDFDVAGASDVEVVFDESVARFLWFPPIPMPASPPPKVIPVTPKPLGALAPEKQHVSRPNGVSTVPTPPDICPFALFTPLTRNFDLEGTVPKIVVAHGTGGLGDPHGWWNRVVEPGDAASADFWVSKSGEVRQYVRLATQTSWSNGPLNKPDLSVPFLAWLVGYKKKNPGVTGNTWTVSVEFEKGPDNSDVLTAAQETAGRDLFQWLSETYAIPKDRAHFLEHNQFDSVTKARCPGPLPWAQLLGQLKAPASALTTVIDLAAAKRAFDGLWHETEQLAALEHRDRAVAIQKQVSALKKAIGGGM